MVSPIFVINTLNIFKPYLRPRSTHIISEFALILSNCFPSRDDIKNKSIHQILNETNLKINIETIRELLGELTLVKLNNLKHEKEKICFWLNCFNYLLLFSIFYLKLNITKKEKWKNFLRCIKYKIGDDIFSLEDMLYILFQKNIFFPNEDFVIFPDHVKSNFVNANVSPFLLYIPNKEFFRPPIYEENNIDIDTEKRIVNHLFCLIRYDKDNKSLNISELIFIFEPEFLEEGKKKYKEFIQEKVYKKIKKKKQNQINIKPINWDLSFDYLLDEAFIEL